MFFSWCTIYHLFSTIFHFFKFCSCSWKISVDLSFAHWFFFLFVQAWFWNSLLNSLIRSLYSSAPKFLVIYYVLYLFVELLIFFCIACLILVFFFLFLILLTSVFFCSSLSILKTIILNYFLVISLSPFIWIQLLEVYSIPLVWNHISLILPDSIRPV